MIHVISIKKKQLHFFFLSLFISALISFIIHMTNSNKNTDGLRCSKYFLIEIENKYNSSVLFNYLKIVYKKEIENLIESHENVSISNDKIYFKNKDCDKDYKLIGQQLKNIREIMRVKLNELINKIEIEDAPLPINDKVMVFDIESNNLIEIKEKVYFLGKNRQHTKTFIHFLIIIILLNFIFYLNMKVKINVK